MSKHDTNIEEVRYWLKGIDLTPIECAELTEDQIWSEAKPKTQIWQARRFSGSPAFYPVYQWRDYFSYSPLALLLKKGAFHLDPKVARLVEAKDWIYLSTSGTLDREIKRIGGPMRWKPLLRTPEQLVRVVAEAVRKDIARIEAAHPGMTNVVMCGGMDSLNLLFLPWKNPVIVASAQPNYPFVKQFISDHSLPFQVIELTDGDQTLSQEILSNFCRNNLEHCRWGPALTEIAHNFRGNMIFWKGQLGGTLFSLRWMDYTNPAGNDWVYLKRFCSVFSGRGEYRARAFLKNLGVVQRRAFDSLWKRGAMWQGAHMSMIRQLTGALAFSAYHGPEMRRVQEQMDLNKSVPYDIRPLIGEYLYGKPIRCPKTNPGPSLSKIRSGKSDLQSFLNVLSTAGFPVVNRKE